MKPYSTKTIKKMLKRVHPLYWTLLAVFVIVATTIGLSSWYGYNYLTSLSLQIASLEQELASATALLKGDIAETESLLSEALSEEKQNVSAIKEQLGGVEQNVGTISGTVTTLEKLSKTDPELLQKYSRVFFLNEHYAPERVTQVPDKYEYYEERNHLVDAQVWPYLERMQSQALRDGIEIYVFSAYRPFEEQRALKGIYSVTYGEGTANQFSADQGYSEHQLGTTVDLITTGIGGTLEGFEGTPAYQWLRANAHLYGFVLSYPEGNDYYVFEPWHWRFVGTDLATNLYTTNRNFYDLEQREIDEYLVSLFD